MRNGEYVMNIIKEIGEEKSNIIMDMITLQSIDVSIKNICDEDLRKELQESFYKIGEDYGNKEIDAPQEEAE